MDAMAPRRKRRPAISVTRMAQFISLCADGMMPHDAYAFLKTGFRRPRPGQMAGWPPDARRAWKAAVDEFWERLDLK
jgi:hypothetical protein